MGADTNQDSRVPRQSDATRKICSVTREVARVQSGKSGSEKMASNGEREHHPRGYPCRRTTRSRDDPAKAWEYSRKRDKTLAHSQELKLPVARLQSSLPSPAAKGS